MDDLAYSELQLFEKPSNVNFLANVCIKLDKIQSDGLLKLMLNMLCKVVFNGENSADMIL